MTSDDREHLNLERRHLAQSTRALSTILESEDARALPLLDFYRALVSYLSFNINRLCLQDQKLADMISARFSGRDSELLEVLDGVYRRLDGHRAAMAELLIGMAAFEQAGPSGQEKFEQAARAYLDARNRNQTQQKHSLARWRDQVITDHDWSAIANVTQAEVAAEQTLFDRMIACAPKDLGLFSNSKAKS